MKYYSITDKIKYFYPNQTKSYILSIHEFTFRRQFSYHFSKELHINRNSL